MTLPLGVHIKPANLNRASGLDLLEPLEALKQAATEQSLAAVDSTVRRALALHLEADPLFPAARKNQKALTEKIEQVRRALAECSVHPLLEVKARVHSRQPVCLYRCLLLMKPPLFTTSNGERTALRTCRWDLTPSECAG